MDPGESTYLYCDVDDLTLRRINAALDRLLDDDEVLIRRTAFYEIVQTRDGTRFVRVPRPPSPPDPDMPELVSSDEED